MSEELEQSTVEVNPGESSAPQPEVESSAPEVAKQETAAKEPQYIPYERFKEINDAKNEFQKRLEEQDRRLKEFQTKFEESSRPKAPSKEQQLVERLKGIDPEFGSWAEKQEASAKELAELKEWRAQAQKEQYIATATAKVSNLKSELKVDASLHSLYLNNIPMGATPEQIEQRYRDMHASTMKYIESEKRASLAEYSKAKKQDAAVPGTTNKSPAPKTSLKKMELSNDPEEARRQIVKRAIEGARS